MYIPVSCGPSLEVSMDTGYYGQKIGSVDESVTSSMLCTWLICKMAHVASIFIFDPLRQLVSSAYGKHYSFVSLQCNFLHWVGVYNKNNCVYVAKHTHTGCINWALAQPLKIQITISLKKMQAIQKIVHTERSKWCISRREEEFSYAGASNDWSGKYHPTSSVFRCLITKSRRGRERRKCIEIPAQQKWISGLGLSKCAVTCQLEGQWIVPKCGGRAELKIIKNPVDIVVAVHAEDLKPQETIFKFLATAPVF